MPTTEILRQLDQAAAGEGVPDTGERRQFRVDRRKAVVLLRRFGLEDPRFFFLELIQAAVANGTDFIELDLFTMRARQDDFTMNWTGRGFTELELSHLFDYLFLSHQEKTQSDIMMLARGINALLHFEPEKLWISSGDGTDEGTRCFRVLDGEVRAVEPVSTFQGVSIRAEGVLGNRMEREMLPEGGFRYGEHSLILEKCQGLDLAFYFNGHEIPRWEEDDRLHNLAENRGMVVKEPDLYGQVWPASDPATASFELMTWGVLIETIPSSQTPLEGMSGSLNFNRLNKTADHARIVRDAMLDQLWARLQPYARHIRDGALGRTVHYNVTRADGMKLAPSELLRVLKDASRVVVAPPSQADRLDLAQRIAQAMDAPVLFAHDEELATLQVLAGPGVELIRPDLESELDLDLLTLPATSPPSRPWLAESFEIPAVSSAKIVELMRALLPGDVPDQTLSSLFAAQSEIRMRVFTPGEVGVRVEGIDGDWVHLLVFGRTIWQGRVSTPFPGHELYVDLPPTSPSELVAASQGLARPLAHTLAQVCARLAVGALRQSTELVLRGFSRATADAITPGSRRCRIAMHALNHYAALHATNGSGVRFALLGNIPAPLMELPLFEITAGADTTPNSLRDIEDLLNDDPQPPPDSPDEEQQGVLARLLRPERHPHHPAFDLTEADMLVHRRLAFDDWECFVGVPAAAIEEPSVLVIERDTGRRHTLPGHPQRTGLVGWVLTEKGDDLAFIARSLAETAQALLAELLLKVAALTDATQLSSALASLLEFAGHHLHLHREPTGRVTSHIADPLAARILDAPFFPTSRDVAVSARRLVRDHCLAHEREARRNDAPFPQLQLADDAPAALAAWISDHLSTRLHFPAPEDTAPPSPPPNPDLANALQGWLEGILGKDVRVSIWPADSAASPDDIGTDLISLDLSPHRSWLLIRSDHRYFQQAATSPSGFQWLALAALDCLVRGDWLREERARQLQGEVLMVGPSPPHTTNAPALAAAHHERPGPPDPNHVLAVGPK